MSTEQSTLIFFVNGKKVVEKNANPEWTLLYYLRNKLQLCGTKLGCSEGGCGACTVMVSKFDRKRKQINHLAIVACLTPVCSMHGLAITTVEGIGSTKTRLHPIQERIAKSHGTQCGFCTPGIVMSMYALLRNTKRPSLDDLETAFQGNLCRCTGYRPIIEGYKTFVEDWESMQNSNGSNSHGATNGTCTMGNQCCKLREASDDFLFDRTNFAPCDETQEPIFPPELTLYDTLDRQNLHFKGERVEWYRPVDLNSLLDLKDKNPEAKLIVGNTELGVEIKFKNSMFPILLQPLEIAEMKEITYTDYGIKVGAAATLQELESALKKAINSLPEHKARIFKATAEMLRCFAGKQIRNVASVGGNIMTGSPVSDLNPIFLAARAALEVISKHNGVRLIKMDQDFFTSYRKTAVKNDEILLNVQIPYTKANQYFYAYKQARRRDDDVAIVNCAFNVFFEPNSNVIQDIVVAYGGMAPTTVSCLRTRNYLVGKCWDEKILDKAYVCLIRDLPISLNAPGGMVQYRRSLTLSFFFRLFLTICEKMQVTLPNIKLDPRDLSAIDGFHSKGLKSSQYFRLVPETQEKNDLVGRPIVHASAYKHATGEAIYCDDVPLFQNELYCGFVYSTKAHANIISVDPGEALQIEGVHGFFSSKDFKEHQNLIGLAELDEEIFISKTVTSQGQIIAAVVAVDQATAQRAAKLVKVRYEELQPIIVSIEDAVKHKSFLFEPRRLEKGDIDNVFENAPHVIEGTCRTGGQEHFYLETQCSVAVPKEDNELEIYTSAQHPSEIASAVARVLEIPQNRIVTRVKRLGGGFGGKESKSIGIAVRVAFIATRINRPVRIMLDRDEDMNTTGGRHPFLIQHKTAFDDDGKILGSEINFYINGGYSKDLSMAVLERAMTHFQNAYNIPVVRVVGYICKTNINSNTVFRGSGGPQSMLTGEYIVRNIAEYLNKNLVDVAKLNLFREGDVTFYNKKLEYCTLTRCWDDCTKSSNYLERKKEVDEYNRENRWKKRGITLVPTMFGVGFGLGFLHQAGALVIVYVDGSVLISHGGIEMGQGLHTKMIQVASRVLEISVSKIHISETATDKMPNTAPTAASISSDLNGPAVMKACQVIKERLESIKRKNPKGNWEDWVRAAYFERISLSATGFFTIPDIEYNWETNSGNPFIYYTYGVACTEVEIDCLTGDHRVLRTDIVMDIGESLNPAVDIGQIEGAFMQGYGLYMMEELVYLPDGTLFTRGPGSYKIPGFSDIPREFNVSLLKGAPNPRAVYSSKAVGEPPLFLSSSVLFAAREAIKSARKDAGITAAFQLDAPATSAKLRLACQDDFVSKFEEPDGSDLIPWNVVP